GGNVSRLAATCARWALPVWWITVARRRRRLTAPRTAWLIGADPWLRPVTNKTGPTAGIPSFARPDSFVHFRCERRVGLPSTNVRPRGSTRREPSNVAPIQIGRAHV